MFLSPNTINFIVIPEETGHNYISMKTVKVGVCFTPRETNKFKIVSRKEGRKPVSVFNLYGISGRTTVSLYGRRYVPLTQGLVEGLY